MWEDNDFNAANDGISYDAQVYRPGHGPGPGHGRPHWRHYHKRRFPFRYYGPSKWWFW